MNDTFDFSHWNAIKIELKLRYPQLTESDLVWREGSQNDLMRQIAARLGMSWKELTDIVNAM